MLGAKFEDCVKEMHTALGFNRYVDENNVDPTYGHS